MPLPPFPATRYLVPEPPRQAPEGFTLIDTPLVAGLPFALPLDAETSLVLTMPTGLALTWRDTDPTTPVSRSEDEWAPAAAPDPAAPVGDAARPPLRLLLQQGGATVASVPLSAGLRRALPDGAARFELVVLSWDVRAGSVRGPGDFGSRLVLAWRRADLAVTEFSTPPPNPQLVPRLPPKDRMESRVGIKYEMLVRKTMHMRAIR
jgi:hypothetical protein